MIKTEIEEQNKTILGRLIMAWEGASTQTDTRCWRWQEMEKHDQTCQFTKKRDDHVCGYLRDCVEGNKSETYSFALKQY